MSAFAHAQGSEEVWVNVQAMRGQAIPSPFTSIVGNDVIDAQLVHADGDVTYYTVVTREGRVDSVSQGPATGATIRVTVQEKVINEVKTASDKKAALKAAYKNKEIRIKGIGARRSITIGFYSLIGRLFA